SCLYHVAVQRPKWELVLVGVREQAWGTRLARLPNVHWFGRRTPEETRGIIADCDVALNPCVLTQWTADALPVKIFDYLAEGKPIVSTPMRELRIFGDLLELAPADGFVSAIEHALSQDNPAAAARRRERAGRYTLQE